MPRGQFAVAGSRAVWMPLESSGQGASRSSSFSGSRFFCSVGSGCLSGRARFAVSWASLHESICYCLVVAMLLSPLVRARLARSGRRG